MITVEPSRVIELLAEFGPHGAREQPELADVDLFDFFSGKDLARLDFSSITMGLGLMFRDSDLRQCVFRGMLLHGSSFTGSDLRGADFRDARVGGSSSFGTTHTDGPVSLLDGARFDNARIGDTTFTSVGLNRCVLHDTKLTANLNDVDFSSSNLSGTTLSGTLTNCNLTDVTGTDMELGGTWSKCVLDGVHLPNARLGATPMMFVDCRAERLSMPGALLADGELIACSFLGADLSGATVKESFIDDCDLSGALLRHADLTGTEFTGGSLAGADLTGATVTGLVMSGVDLTGAIISAEQLAVIELSG